MKIVRDEITFTTRGNNEIKDLTGPVDQRLAASRLRNGLVTLFVPGSTAGLTTMEYEGGLVDDLSSALERLIPGDIPYKHDERWGDRNGYAHVRHALIGPSLTIPFTEGRLELGTWQQIIFIDFDNRPRTRKVILQFIGE